MQIKKRIEKKHTKKLLSHLICGPLSRPFMVLWSPAWRGALSLDQLQHVKKAFRFRRCTAGELPSLLEHVSERYEEMSVRCDEPARLIPVCKLPPEIVFPGGIRFLDE